ncbi:MAG: HAD-IIA family hydrolase [Chloroflexaceae bacterium]|nr:HAD-IIA family hydrolase [Chloroflexaceae bacterium]
MLHLASIRTLLIDIDGVLYRGKTVLPGAEQLIAFCQKHGIAFACITNNGSLTPQQYEQKLAAIGLHIPVKVIFTSALVTGYYLRSTYPRGTSVYAIGMRGLHEAIFHDDALVAGERQAQVVVLGPDFEVTYEKLKIGCLAIRNGADFIVTNPDRTLPTEEGLIPDAGALAAALEAATDITPLVIGKPQPAMFRLAMEHLQGQPASTLVIGDRLETDIAGARNAGVQSLLVLTGVSQRSELASSPYQPDAVFDDLPAVLHAWHKAR